MIEQPEQVSVPPSEKTFRRHLVGMTELAEMIRTSASQSHLILKNRRMDDLFLNLRYLINAHPDWQNTTKEITESDQSQKKGLRELELTFVESRLRIAEILKMQTAEHANTGNRDPNMEKIDRILRTIGALFLQTANNPKNDSATSLNVPPNSLWQASIIQPIIERLRGKVREMEGINPLEEFIARQRLAIASHYAELVLPTASSFPDSSAE